VIQFGLENFCRISKETGIDGVILPDLPPLVFTEEYSEVFNNHGLYNILLVSPQSTADRISMIDSISKGFIYMVSSSAVTGSRGSFTDEQITYFKRVSEMNLKNPCLIGFGISEREAFLAAGKYARGGIIGSAFLKMLGQNGVSERSISEFVNIFRS
jgi:tryptophan synthase alpha chain